MAGDLKSIFTVVLTVESITGIVGNGFIVLLNFTDWVKRRKISPVDQILTTLAISRIVLLCSVQTYIWLYAAYPDFLKTARVFTAIIFITWVVTNHFSVWLSTCLSIFYFLKIANFSNSIFLYLKWKVKKVVLVTLQMSLVPLFFSIIIINIKINAWIDGSRRNVSYNSSLKNSVQVSRLLLFTNSMFMLLPYIVSLIVCLLLVFSLGKHLKRMQHDAKGSRDTRTMAHTKAMQTVVIFILLYTTYLFCFIMQISSFEFLEKAHIMFFEHAIGITFLLGHSLFLILGNSKLRKASLSALWWLRCRAKGAESSGP
ncbi:taste receptor type 2 member 14-like [Fukomys damarensis]|uniref:taste receptor type 2 member 14-like n=1 Tax=Fukomys damarensis TaxID=885580 RepID=UPI00053F5C2F|nr:taste receptor type 2 member 14-like [Fukomys damarensis]